MFGLPKRMGNMDGVGWHGARTVCMAGKICTAKQVRVCEYALVSDIKKEQ